MGDFLSARSCVFCWFPAMLFVLLPRWKSVLQVLGSLDVMLQADFFDPFCAMGQENRQNAVQVVKKLLSDEGWIGLYRGLGPRFFSMSAWGTCMILAYEYISLYSYLTLQILGRCFQSGVQCCQHNFLSVGRHSTEIFGSR
ncbi:uncharacterized protein LOC130803249 isoform X2 [Amaranthus tricolor]|uniref:uncharacterized protein LOC130803249 isoform X2 n=1 Tax=Amaranthus tricolor TaxID=29722 RepID=UPI002583899E|nr:uncharacterized protein LOC130803249 isoform X2 [Amaranthus tricolor]XP_057523420.1 uncharacterized protein LOC130803249 isoform X2 [Amaranthus tricolor]XP_057523421.1 uncharacterized protein LOC130803249 isoform X2 [Amaranthus tricolor]